MTDEILSLALRPRTLSGLVGQKNLTTAIRAQMRSKRRPRAWMFTGQSGGGKTTIARIVALSLQCEHQTPDTWGDPCEACWKQRSDYSILEINASEVSGVEEIGKIASDSKLRPMPPSKYRVYILDEAQLLTNNSQSLLLKPFEDKSADTTVWIICTTAPNKILPTLRRRCMTYAVQPLSLPSRELLLKRAAKKIGYTKSLEPLFDEVHKASISSPALLLMVLEKFVAGLTPQAAVQGQEVSGDGSYAMLIAMSRGDWNGVKAQLQKTTADDARLIRGSAAGWLRGMLFKESNPKRQAVISDCLLSLLGVAPLDDAALHTWLIAQMWQITRKLG